MRTNEAIGFIGSMCLRMFGLLVLIAEAVIPLRCRAQRDFVSKQREWFREQQDMLEMAAMVDEAMGDRR